MKGGIKMPDWPDQLYTMVATTYQQEFPEGLRLGMSVIESSLMLAAETQTV